MTKFVALLLLCLVPLLHAKREKPTTVEDVCTFDCIQDLYREFCGGATCVHGVETAEQQEAMCSDKCLDVLFGEPGNACLASNLPDGADTEDFIDFLKIGIYDFCFDGLPPSEEAPSSEEAYESYLNEQQAWDLIDSDI